ncbi:hypothetical protein KKQ91_06135 [Clostridioides difficile]|nr:hypothetical protein [Clostridioides difficile]
MDRLKYISSETFYEGIIVDIKGGGVTIDLKGRLGQFKIPNRMLITDYELKIGQEVGFMLSYPEVLSPEPNQEYVENIRREKENKQKCNQNKKKNNK